MGIGSKPFMDIKPSDAAISDRAIDYIMKGSGEHVCSVSIHVICSVLNSELFLFIFPSWFTCCLHQ